MTAHTFEISFWTFYFDSCQVPSSLSQTQDLTKFQWSNKTLIKVHLIINYKTKDIKQFKYIFKAVIVFLSFVNCANQVKLTMKEKAKKPTLGSGDMSRDPPISLEGTVPPTTSPVFFCCCVIDDNTGDRLWSRIWSRSHLCERDLYFSETIFFNADVINI